MVGAGLKLLHLKRGGEYWRVADPDWTNPMDGRSGMASGGRWNAPASFPAVYLNGSVSLARLFVAHKLHDQPYGPEDLDPDSAPVLVTTDIAEGDFVDIVTDAGCAAAGLPETYPIDTSGEVIRHETCWPIGQAAWNQGERGIACRSATRGASKSEELAWFQRNRKLLVKESERFVDWFFG
ncbi:MAG TPA: RES family NAD+ phosphorylase [Rhodothermales bacterium]|jgi:hypothetical protein